MQVFPVSEGRYFLRLELGEEAMATLRTFAVERGIGVAALRGLGACSEAELAYYDLPEKRYETFRVDEITEVLSLTGNIGRGEDGTPIVHAHAGLGRRDGSMIGGHVMRLITGATLEVDVEVFPGTLRRRLDRRIGLPLQAALEGPARGSDGGQE